MDILLDNVKLKLSEIFKSQFILSNTGDWLMTGLFRLNFKKLAITRKIPQSIAAVNLPGIKA